MAFWAGKNKFMVAHDGYLKAEGGYYRKRF